MELSMANLVVRQDPVELAGKIVSIHPPLTGFPSDSPVGKWIVVIRPDPVHQALLATQNGQTNPDGNLDCTVGVDSQVVSAGQLLLLLSNTLHRRVRAVGTWCDDLDTARTVIFPLGMLAIEYDVEVYDISGWPVAVRDLDLLAFAHTGQGLAAVSEPHAGESQTHTLCLPFPMRPSDFAIPFARIYPSTRVDLTASASFNTIDQAGTPLLEATIETGEPAAGLGFFAAQIGLTFDEPELDNYCPPGTCDLDGLHCAHEGLFRFTRIPAHLPYAQKGELALSPGDGHGFISGIVASLSPPQVYDHMGIFIDNGWTIRHCTSSMDRLEDDSLFTAELTIKLAGIIELTNEKIPLNGFRPDLVRFGWPGSITQTVEEVYRTGRNSLNPRWTYAATHPGQDLEDPERPGEPFRIFHLPRAERQRRLQFNDPERDKGESMVRLQDRPVNLVESWQGCPPPSSALTGPDLREFTPRLVRPHTQFDAQVRPTLHRVAEMARKIDAHYRFAAYSRGDIGFDPSFLAPAANDGIWASLPPGAGWPAGTLPAMCSSFVWTAVQLANQDLPPGALPILLEDRATPEDPGCGLEYGSMDGFYRYHADERIEAGKRLVAKIQGKIRDRFDKKIPGVAYDLLPSLLYIRDTTATRVGNQIANAFAADACELLDETWAASGEGETVSPDDTLNHWDLKPQFGELVQPEGRQAIYGDSVPIQLTAPQWKRIPLFRKQEFDLGTGHVTGVAFVNGTAIPAVTVRFDHGCATATTTEDRETAFLIELGTGVHFAEAFILLPNPISGNPETFRTPKPLEFQIDQGQVTHIQLHLEPPSDLWRIVDIHLDADIHDRSFWGGDADARRIIMDPSFELRQDLEDDPDAPDDQRNSVLHYEKAWRTEPAVGSGVHVSFVIIADLEPADRSVRCHCEVALIDTDDGGFLGIGSSHSVDQLEVRDDVIPADGTIDILRDFDFSSNETVPERARVTLTLHNRRRPS
jgi:hypothetical protein